RVGAHQALALDRRDLALERLRALETVRGADLLQALDLEELAVDLQTDDLHLLREALEELHVDGEVFDDLDHLVLVLRERALLGLRAALRELLDLSEHEAELLDVTGGRL